MIFFEVAWPALVPHNLTVGASTGGQLAQDPGRTYAYWRATRQRPRPHLRQNMRRGKHTVRAALFSDQTSTTTPAAKGIQVLQAPLRKSIRRAESAEKALQLSRDQIRQLRDQKTAQLPVEVDLYACSVQHGVDPTAPQATQKPVARRRPMITHIGPDHKQPPPPPKAHFALDYRAAGWSPFRIGGALPAPAEETKSDRWVDKDRDRAATAHHWPAAEFEVEFSYPGL